MFKTHALTLVALVTTMVLGNVDAQAQNTQEKTGRVVQPDGSPQPTRYWCVKPPSKAFVQCSKSEYERYQAEMKRQRQEKEMAAEQRAYDKMKQERQQKATKTEHCYMKNGQLDCKPVP